MHEWALAKSVIDTVINIEEKENFPSIEEIVVGIGEFQDIDIDIFKDAIDEIKLNTSLKDTKFVYKTIPARLKCQNCGHEWSYNESAGKLTEEERENIHFIPETAHIYIKCPVCGSVDFEMIEGRGVFIEEIKRPH